MSDHDDELDENLEKVGPKIKSIKLTGGTRPGAGARKVPRTFMPRELKEICRN